MTAAHLAFLALKIIAAWTVISFTVAALICWFITRGKMDSHRRDDRAGSGDPVVLRGGGERGLNIDHSTLV